MIIQAELKRKQSEYEGETCTVDKVIELPAQRFQQFSRACWRIMISSQRTKMLSDTMMTPGTACSFSMQTEQTASLLTRSYNYARYSAFVPNARSLLTQDMETDRSYLSPAEPWRDESRDEMLRMTLRVDGKPDYTLVLPADEEYLDAVKLTSILMFSRMPCSVIFASRCLTSGS